MVIFKHKYMYVGHKLPIICHNIIIRVVWSPENTQLDISLFLANMSKVYASMC